MFSKFLPSPEFLQTYDVKNELKFYFFCGGSFAAGFFSTSFLVVLLILTFA